jgi:hypothetical protein
MGRTVPTWTIELANLLAVWEREFGRTLVNPEDREAFRQLTLEANRYCAYAKMMASGDRVERALLSIILGQQRRIIELERRVGVPPDATRFDGVPAVELPKGQRTMVEADSPPCEGDTPRPTHTELQGGQNAMNSAMAVDVSRPH